jgi:hypothetical protein
MHLNPVWSYPIDLVAAPHHQEEPVCRLVGHLGRCGETVDVSVRPDPGNTAIATVLLRATRAETLPGTVSPVR